MKIGIVIMILLIGMLFSSGLMVLSAQMTGAEIQKLVDEKTRDINERLDRRAESIDQWLAVLGIVVAFFGVVIPILIALVSVFNIKRFLKLESDGRSIIDKLESDVQRFKNDVRRILADSEKYSIAIKEEWSKVKNLLDESPENTTTNSHEDAAESIQEITDWSELISRGKEELNKAYKLQQEGKINEAIEKWRNIAVTANGNDELAAIAWTCLGELYFKEHDDNQTTSSINNARALSALDKALELKPDFAEAYSLRGTVKFSLNADREAIDDFDKAIRLKDDDARSYNGRALVKYFLEEYQDVISDCDSAINIRPDVAHKLRGDANTAIGRYDDALKDYNNAIHFDQDNAEVYLGRANLNVLLNKYEAAIDDLDKTIDLKNDHAKAHALRGTMKWGLDRIDEAMQDFQSAYELAKQQEHSELALYSEKQLQKLNNTALLRDS